MRHRLANVISIVALTWVAGHAMPEAARAACCIEGCGTVPWVSCTTTNQCTGGFCPGPIGSAISFNPDATCGEGDFSSCPPNEVGQCTDGVNNDAWTGDVRTDCEDPDCASDQACPTTGVPVTGGAGLAATAAALLAIGMVFLRSRVRG